MPNNTLFEQIQALQNAVAERYNGFTNDDQEKLNQYSQVSKEKNFLEKQNERMESPEKAQLKEISERLGTLAAHYPKNSTELAALREHIPDIGQLRKEKMDALRTDAGRSGMDKLLNDFFGSKRRAAREELARMRQSRASIDGRDRTNVVKAPEHAGKGRNIYTPITNVSGLGTHEQRHYDGEDFLGKKLSIRTKSGLLDGTKIQPAAKPNGKVVLVFSGSGEPAESVIEDIAEGYTNAGAAVVVFNYRGFGKSMTLDSSGNQIGTPLSEQSIYEDGMEMYKYVRDVMGVSPENITLHGYSLGGAVASHVAANVAEQNKLKMDKGIPVPDSRKLGGVVLQSPMGSMYSAAKTITNSSVMAYFGTRGSGEYNTKENMRRLYRNDPDIPVAYISGRVDKGDYLSLEATQLHQDPQAPFKNASCSFAECGHLDRGEMLAYTSQHITVAVDGRNAKLNTQSLHRQGDAPVQEQAQSPSLGL